MNRVDVDSIDSTNRLGIGENLMPSPFSCRALLTAILMLALALAAVDRVSPGGRCGSQTFAASPADVAPDRTAASAGDEPAAVSLTFEKDVRPILKAHCFLCHGEEPEKAGELDLRLVRRMVEGGDSGAALVPGEPDESLVWHRIDDDEMPPGPKKLSDQERTVISAWIRQGANTVREEPLDPDEVRFTEEERGHWAFRPVVRPELPAVPEAGRHLAPIDRFVYEKLRERGLAFSAAADRRTWLRRVTFGLTGLPPTREEISDFLADGSADAERRVVDRLLKSPQYGVRWARHWLDVAGYAESEGQVEKDRPRPHMWRYRDYVVDALNRDLPYDRFLVEQLAGDLLIDGPVDPNDARHARLIAATGFLRQARDITQTDDTLANRNQTVADTLDIVSSSILGLTVACAQCHDHRYDPILIEDYYRLRAVFEPVMPIRQWRKPSERLVDMTDDATRAARDAIEAEAVALQQDINDRRRAHCQTIQDREIDAAPEAVRDLLRQAIDTPPKERTPAQTTLLDRYPKVRTIDWIVGQLVEYDNAAHRRFQEEEKQVTAIRARKPLDRVLMAVRETESPVESHVFFRGDPESPGEPVGPGELSVLVSHRAPRSAIEDRLDYARHLTDGNHPLVARVIVNRVWLHHFGQGLVRTPGDFGLNGERPTHPELLDWLADDLVRHGWSLKRLHRQIVLSRTYGQASGLDPGDRLSADRAVSDDPAWPTGDEASPTSHEVARASWLDSRQRDPENRWLGRMPLRRLDAEAIRDAILAISDQLDVQLSGPSVAISEDQEGKAVIGSRRLRDGLFAGIDGVGREAARRSLYLSAQRSLRLDLLQTFDLPEMVPNCQLRDASTVTPQALLLMNDGWVVNASEQMAGRLWSGADTAEDRVRLAFELAFARPPTAEELDDSLAFWERQADMFRQFSDPDWREKLREQPDAASLRGLASLCQMLIASNRFLYLE